MIWGPLRLVFRAFRARLLLVVMDRLVVTNRVGSY